MPMPTSPVDSTPQGFDPERHCGARSRNATPCMREAGWGTQHVGVGRCKMHGGNAGRPILHGLYSEKYRTTISDRIEEVVNSPELLSVDREVAALKVIAGDEVERYGQAVEDYEAALANWRDQVVASEDGEVPAMPRPPKFSTEIIDGLARVVKLSFEMRYTRRNSIPVAELEAMLTQIRQAFVTVAQIHGIPREAVLDFATRLSQVRVSRPMDVQLDTAMGDRQITPVKVVN